MIEIGYFVGLVLLFPFYIGTIANHLKYYENGDPEGVDYVLAGMITVIALWFYPVLVPGYYAVQGVKALTPDFSFLRFVFPVAPAPKDYKTREAIKVKKHYAELETARNKERAERAAKQAARRRTNQLEADAGIPLTVWED